MSLSSLVGTPVQELDTPALVVDVNALDANIAVGATDPLKHPLFILRGYSGSAYPSSVKLGGVSLVRDTDYFPSLRSDAGELWITLNRDLSGATNHLQVSP